MDHFRIYLGQQATLIGEDSGLPDEEASKQLIPGELFLDEADIEIFYWREQEMLLTRAVTETMWANWAEFIQDDEGTVPIGKYPDAEGKTFILTLGQRRLCTGIIAGIQVLYNTPACTLIYPGQPLIQDGQMTLGIGNPRIAECGEDFLKIFVEEGSQDCFSKALGEEVREHFAELGKLADSHEDARD